jgi:peptidoglycan/LPS O-acetylase OafA/YrhL
MAVETTGTASGNTDARAAQKKARGTKRKYFPELQGLRGWAVIAVVTVHTALTTGVLGYGTHPRDGALAIIVERFTRESLPVLFALSGLLIFRPFALAIIADVKRPALRPYFWRRVLRIYPAYWLMALIVLPVLNLHNITGVWYLIRVATMQTVYTPNGIPQGMEATWSMATESAFYVFVPVFAFIVAKFARRATDPVGRARRLLIPIALIGAGGYGFTAYSHQASLGLYPIQGNWPLGWMGFIALGMALATMSAAAETSPDRMFAPYRLIAKRPIMSWLAALGVIILYCFSPFNDQGTSNYPNFGTAMFNQPVDLLIVFLVMAPLTVPYTSYVKSRFIDAVLTNRPIQYIGRISYSIYIWHIAMIYFWNGGLIGAHGFLVGEIIVLGGSIGIATGSWFLLERPVLQLRERLGKTSLKPSVAVLATPEPSPAPVLAAPQAELASS